MKRLLAALLLAAWPAAAQRSIPAAPCKITDESCAPMPNATTLGCAANSVAVFLGTPVALSCDGGLTYDATTDVLTAGALAARNVTATALATPGAITVTNQGTPGGTTVTYKLVALLADGTTTEAGAASSTATSNATLSASNFNRLTWSAVTGATSYRVYRTVAPTSPATTGIVYAGTALTVDDTGLAGGGETAPTSNATGVGTVGRLLIGVGGAVKMSAVTSGDSGISMAGYRSFGFGSGVGGDTSGTVAAANLSATAAVSGSTYNVFSSGLLKFYGSSSYDLGLSHGTAAKSLAVGGGTAGDTTGSVITSAYVVSSPSGALQTSGYTTESLTLNTGGTSTTTSGSLLPAGSVIRAITGRVTTTITTAANFTVAPTGTAAWVLAGTATSSLTGLVAGSTFTLVPPSGASYSQDAANTITVTTNANPGAGVIRFVVFYEAFSPPTS